jgi:hypothetical protein
MDTSTTQIIAANVLLMNTYLIPNGGSKQPEYNTSNPSSAVGFTPSSHGDYSVEVINQRTDVVTKIEAYLPLPKQGLNF